MIANRLWIIEYKATSSNGQWYPTVPRHWFDFKREALKELQAKKREQPDSTYRAAAYVRATDSEERK